MVSSQSTESLDPEVPVEQAELAPSHLPVRGHVALERRADVTRNTILPLTRSAKAAPIGPSANVASTVR